MKKVLLVSLFIFSVSLFANAQLKPPITGLACRDFGRIQSADDDVMKNINAIIVQLNWNEIQPQENGAIVRDNDLDKAIKWVQSFKAKHGVDIALKVRLYCGFHSPDWLLKKAGYLEARGERIPKFWKPDFITAFADVQSKLAAIYDNVPEVREVVDGGTSLTTAEALIRPFKESPKAQMIANAFLNAGYSAEADSVAIVKSFDAMKVWKKTLVSVCFSNWKTVDKNGNTSADVSRTFGFVKIFVSKFGKQAVIGNNGLRPGMGSKHGERWQEGGDMYALYNYFKKVHDEQGVQIYFQTASDQRIGDLQQAIKDGIAYGASYIELPGAPRDYTGDLPVTAMNELSKQLKANIKG